MGGLQIGLLGLRCRRNVTPVSKVCQATPRSLSPPQRRSIKIAIIEKKKKKKESAWETMGRG